MIKFLGISIYKKCKILLCRKLTFHERLLGDLNKSRVISYSWMGRLNMVKMTFFPNLVKRFNSFLIKISVVFSLGIGQLDFKVHLEE